MKFKHKDLNSENIWLHLLKGGADRRYRDILGEVAKQAILKSIPLKINHVGTKFEAIIDMLHNYGRVNVSPIFSSEEIDAILFQLASKTLRYKDASNGQVFYEAPLDKLPDYETSFYGYYKEDDLLRIPEIQKIINSPSLIKIPFSYLGCAPTLSSVSCWWSFPTDKPQGAQYFHIDRGDFSSLNLFVYLNDVDEHNGPHEYCGQTHTYKHLSDFSQKLSDAEKKEFWVWVEKHRKTDQEVLKYYKPEVICGPKGSSFYEDTRGFHKGRIPTKGRRICFELVYTLVPQFNSELKNPVLLGDSGYDEIMRYVNRLAYNYI